MRHVVTIWSDEEITDVKYFYSQQTAIDFVYSEYTKGIESNEEPGDERFVHEYMHGHDDGFFMAWNRDTMYDVLCVESDWIHQCILRDKGEDDCHFSNPQMAKDIYKYLTTNISKTAFENNQQDEKIIHN